MKQLVLQEKLNIEIYTFNRVIVEFNIPKNELHTLNGKQFNSGNSEWLDFVTKNRNGMANAIYYTDDSYWWMTEMQDGLKIKLYNPEEDRYQ